MTTNIPIFVFISQSLDHKWPKDMAFLQRSCESNGNNIYLYLKFLINSSANSEHLTSVAPSIRRAKSYVTTLEAIVFSTEV